MAKSGLWSVARFSCVNGISARARPGGVLPPEVRQVVVALLVGAAQHDERTWAIPLAVAGRGRGSLDRTAGLHTHDTTLRGYRRARSRVEQRRIWVISERQRNGCTVGLSYKGKTIKLSMALLAAPKTPCSPRRAPSGLRPCRKRRNEQAAPWLV
jgi:hypothetical protein